MDAAWRKVFEEDELLDFYNKLPANLIHKPIDKIKKKLVDLVTNENLPRPMYKELFKDAKRIKRKGPTRNRRNLAKYTSIESIELPELVSEPSKRQKKKFLKRYCEELRTKKGSAEFKSSGELQRNAGWIVGQKPQLSCGRPATECDGTSCIAMYIQSNFSNYREQLRKHGGKSRASEGSGVLADITNSSNNSATGSACDQLPAGSSDEDPSDDDDDL